MTKPPEPVVTGELKVTQEDRDRLLEILALWDIGRKQEALEQVARHRTAHALSGDVVSAVVVEKIETVAGDFSTESGEPFWRVRIGEQCADFDFEQAARNFADAIAALTPSALSGDAGEGEAATTSELIAAAIQYRDDLRHPPQGDSVQRRLDWVETIIAKATDRTAPSNGDIEWEGDLTGEEQAMVDSAWDRHVAAGPQCEIPPEGWICTRGAGHDGPCAALPSHQGAGDE